MKVAIIGGTRGLGRALVECYHSAGHSIFVVGRKVAREFAIHRQNMELDATDLSRGLEAAQLAKRLTEFAPDLVIYCAGGGPHGNFASKQFKDHRWAWQVSFLSAARILHKLSGQSPIPQTVLIGSALCETRGEATGASYAAAKHALVGLYQSLRLEQPDWDLRLFSPGYMDTELLPARTAPRTSGKKINSPIDVANRLIDWVNDTTQHGAWWIESGPE